MVERESIQSIIQRYKNDSESVYNTWYINSEARLKAFGAIRRGVEEVINDIKEGTFPTDFKGSSLEVVLAAITEQKQVFEGAAHPFYWKPKLKIPDIYENKRNQAIFGQFLESCLKARREDQLTKEILKLSQCGIKGLGPAVANILYFIHPMLIPPFNTAMVKGFNWLFGKKKKLGSWDSYLEMRDTILEVNDQFKNLLSKDLGAISGLLFDIGVGEIVIGPNGPFVGDKERETRHKKRIEKKKAEIEEEDTHTKIQYLLVKIGRALGYDVVVARNDRTKSYDNQSFSFISLPKLPAMNIDEHVLNTIDLIDVIWFRKGTNQVVCAYEVEKTTSIITGIKRMEDLALTLPHSGIMLCLVAPDSREKEVIAQLTRPSMATREGTKIWYILFSKLCEHCDSICELGDDCKIMERVAKHT